MMYLSLSSGTRKRKDRDENRRQRETDADRETKIEAESVEKMTMETETEKVWADATMETNPGEPGERIMEFSRLLSSSLLDDDQKFFCHMH